ncbi:MAG TPA: DUF1592 domain-containing protein [Polyangia bacterium]|nr:DUF1592 domain-containing protein [Polyangia bacterium]
MGSLACSAGKTPPNSTPGGSGGVSGGGGNSGLGGQPAPGQFMPAPAGLRRLTMVQYRNTIADLLGSGVTVSKDFEGDTALSGFASIGAARVSLSNQIIEEFETSALSLATQALSDPTKAAALVGCNPTAVTDDACTQAFIKKFGRRAWRRPLTDAEVTTYSGVAKTAQTTLKNYFSGLGYGLAGLLESPHFLYREEWGTADPANPNRMVFNDYELATRLSYFLWNSTPDDALLDAADAHQLTEGAGFGTQVQRLLKSPRAAIGAQNFFTEYYRLADLDSLPQLPSAFSQKTDTLGPAMREETLRFLTDIAITRDADYREIFDSPTTFVNAELAKLYGLPPVTGTDFVKTTLPDSGVRVGYLGQGSFLALNAHSNIGSPTYRGKFIREMLMCETIPPPPMNVPPLPDDSAAPVKQTMRQKLEIHRAMEPCKTCHTLMDPLGLAFENFDGIGAFRTTDAGQPIDVTGDLDGLAFNGPRELAKAMHDNPNVATCVARNLYRYVVGHVEVNSEEAAIQQLAQQFKDGKFQFSALLNGMVQNAAFTYAAPPSEDTGAGGAPGSGGSGGASGTGGAPVDAGPADVGRPDSGTVDGPVVPTGPISYAMHVAPIIANKCSPCHTTDAKAGLNFSYANLVTNSTVTNALTVACDWLTPPPKRVVPGDTDHSLLWVKLTFDGAITTHMCGDHMPLATSGKTVTTAELDIIQRWINQGAKP